MGNGQCKIEIATRQRGESAFDGQNQHSEDDFTERIVDIDVSSEMETSR